VISRLVLVLPVMGCFFGPAPAEPTRPPAKPALVVDSRPAEIATEPQRSLFVAACNTGCIDCGLGTYKSYVIGNLARTGAELFPSPDPPAPGYSCGAMVAIGEHVTFRAHSQEGLEIESWQPFFATDFCPCAGTNTAVCHVDVTPEIAAHYTRIYCGATWQKGHGARIAH